MIEKFNKRILTALLAIVITAGGYSSAEAKSWSFEDNVQETMELKVSDIPNGNAIVTLSFRDTDIKQVMRMFADKAGLNIIFVGDIDGTVTMDLVDTSLSSAIALVAESEKLTYLIDNKTLIVMSLDKASGSSFGKKSMRVIPVKYCEASAVAKFLNKNIFGLGKPGLSSGDIVVTNPSRNELIVFGSDNDYKMIMNVLPKVDVKPKATTYKINHVTPKEMAMLVCETLFPSAADSGLSKLAGSFTGAASEISLGAGTIACKIGNTVEGGGVTSISSTPITVMYNPGLGTLNIIGGSEEQIQLINDFILLHDKKQSQAVLEFAVLELNESGQQLFQNEWHFINNTMPIEFAGDVLHLGSLIFFGGDTGIKNPDGPYGVNSWGRGAPALWDTITWLEQTNKGKLLQKPSIVITNGAESVIDLTQDYIEKTDSQVSETTFSESLVVTRTYTIGKNQGMKMTITPFISTDGYVTMDLKIEYATPYKIETGTDQAGEHYVAATLLERRNLTLSSIRVKNGETLVLGGMIYENDTQGIGKVPILGDIPGLGVFFRNTENQKQKNELVIMITPRLIEDTEDTVDI